MTAQALSTTEPVSTPGANRLDAWLRRGVVVIASACILVTGALWINHIGFPFYLDLMEGSILEHVRRAAAGRWIYVAPDSHFIPFAYNPLYYYVSAGFGLLFGFSLSTLRLVAILGHAAMLIVTYIALRRRVGLAWVGWVGAGMMAGAYGAMDFYLDTAHSDSWMVATALLGAEILDRDRSIRQDCLGMLLLVVSFWFKQHGAMFALGGLVYLTWRHRQRAWPIWIVFILAGPCIYILAGPVMFGPSFHYYTYWMPAGWSHFRIEAILRPILFGARHYFILAIISTLWIVWARFRARMGAARFNIWHAMFIMGCASACLGAVDAGSSDNVFIPFGVFTILLGVLAIYRTEQRFSVLARLRFKELAYFASFALLAYDPRAAVCSFQSDRTMAEFEQWIQSLDRPVCVIWLGTMPAESDSPVQAHWVAVEDMIRGPGKVTENNLTARRIYAPLYTSEPPALLLSNHEIKDIGVLAFLGKYYEEPEHLGNRFEPLRTLPGRYNHKWPRFLYRPKKSEDTSIAQRE